MKKETKISILTFLGIVTPIFILNIGLVTKNWILMSISPWFIFITPIIGLVLLYYYYPSSVYVENPDYKAGGKGK
jgi:hypothetical protein